MKNIEIPFIKLLRVTKNTYYVFDVNTNNILGINEQVYRYLESLVNGCGNTKELSDSDRMTVENMYETGLLRTYPNVKIQHVMTDDLEDLLDKRLSTVCLQVTQNCNLRCTYCVYSGNYVNRGHSNKTMSWDIAKKGIDYLYNHSLLADDVSLGFYGGEPLLEIDLIYKCVDYAKQLFKDRELSFHVTTNGTLLSLDIAEFLLANKFHITLSLDGPKEIQNLNRIYANGRGSFDDFMNNVYAMFEKFPDAYDRVNTNSVISPQTDLELVTSFFDNDKHFKHVNSSLTTQNEVNLKDDEELQQNDKNTVVSSLQRFRSFLYAIGRVPENMLSTSAFAYLSDIAETVHLRPINDMVIAPMAHPGGPCVPGQQRLFIDVDGEFLPCERVSEESPIMRMGSLEQGIDIQSAKRILNVASVTSKECSHCWAFNFCTQCINGADGITEVSREKRLNECDNIRLGTESKLIDYIVLQETGCQFEKLKGVDLACQS